jgi:flagellin
MGESEISFTIPKLDTSSLAIEDSDSIKAFRDAINDAYSSIGSAQNGFESSINSLLVARTNTLAAYSQMADTDIAKSVSDLKNGDLLIKSGLYAQAHQKNIDQNRIAALLA